MPYPYMEVSMYHQRTYELLAHRTIVRAYVRIRGPSTYTVQARAHAHDIYISICHVRHMYIRKRAQR